MPSNNIPDEKELFLQITEGNEAAFSALYRSYVPRLEPFIKSMTKDDGLVGEVIQETFVRIWLNREGLADVTHPRAWIYKTAAYVCAHYLRRQALERQAADRLATAPGNDATGGPLALKDLERVLQKGIARLTPAQQRIYRLSREQGMKIPEIAARLSISPNTVKNTLVTCLRSLREYARAAGYSLSLLLLWCWR